MPERFRHESSDSRIASLKQQNKEYNEMYRKWRIDHADDYGFYFQGSSELTYRSGEGFITKYPEASERHALNGINSVIAKTLIMYTLLTIANLLLFSDLPIAVTYKVSFSSGGFFTGDEDLTLILSYVINILRRLLPMFYFMGKVRMPAKVMFPMKVSNKPLFHAAVPMAMFTYGIFTLLSGVEVFIADLIGINAHNTIWLPESSSAMIMSAILYTVIIPIISELVHHGVLLHILSQFGDGYALLLTSMICALTTDNNRALFFSFAYSLVIGYFTMRSGSVLTALIMRIFFTSSSYWLTFIKNSWTDTGKYLNVTLAVILIYLVAGGIATVMFLKKHSNKINLPLHEMYMTEKEKLICFVSEPLMIVWLSLSVLALLISVNLC